MELIRRTVSVNNKNIFSIYLIVVVLSGCATNDFVSVPNTQPTNTILKKETSDNNILSIRSALHENRNSIDLYLKLATELVKNQNYSEAIYNLDIALNENPDSFLALNLRGEIHY
jgi:Tfp pilus assembly protein PilF